MTIRSSLLGAAISLARTVRRRNRPGPVVLCLAPAPEANRGDQALNHSAVDELRRRGHQDLVLVATSQHDPESFREDDRTRIVSDLHYVFQTDRCLSERLRWLKLVSSSAGVVVIGADVLDEGYSRERSAATFWAVRAAERIGTPTRVIGFSVNGPPSSELGGRIAELKHTRLYARDPTSYARLLHTAHNLFLSGDLAILLEPAPWHEVNADVRSYLDEHIGNVVGINLTEVVLGKDPERFFDRLATAFVSIARKLRLKYLLIPHDEQGGVEFLRRFSRVLESKSPGIGRMPDSLPSARQLKAIAGRCRHIFTCRLHLGIAALGMGRPITCFPYQGKFEGQFEHFDLPADGLLNPDTLPDDDVCLAELLQSRIAQSEMLAESIRRRLPQIQALSRNSFDDLPQRFSPDTAYPSC